MRAFLDGHLRMLLIVHSAIVGSLLAAVLVAILEA